jgi:hypothetical protein
MASNPEKVGPVAQPVGVDAWAIIEGASIPVMAAGLSNGFFEWLAGKK